MALQIRGKVHKVYAPITKQTANGQSFTTQELVLDCTRIDDMTGKMYPNFPSVIVYDTGLIVGLQPGQIVKVSIDVRGRYYSKEGVESHFNEIRCYRIDREPMQGGVQVGAQQVVQAPVQQAVQAPVQQPTFVGQEQGSDLPF